MADNDDLLRQQAQRLQQLSGELQEALSAMADPEAELSSASPPEAESSLVAMAGALDVALQPSAAAGATPGAAASAAAGASADADADADANANANANANADAAGAGAAGAPDGEQSGLSLGFEQSIVVRQTTSMTWNGLSTRGFSGHSSVATGHVVEPHAPPPQQRRPKETTGGAPHGAPIDQNSAVYRSAVSKWGHPRPTELATDAKLGELFDARSEHHPHHHGDAMDDQSVSVWLGQRVSRSPGGSPSAVESSARAQRAVHKAERLAASAASVARESAASSSHGTLLDRETPMQLRGRVGKHTRLPPDLTHPAPTGFHSSSPRRMPWEPQVRALLAAAAPVAPFD